MQWSSNDAMQSDIFVAKKKTFALEAVKKNELKHVCLHSDFDPCSKIKQFQVLLLYLGVFCQQFSFKKCQKLATFGLILTYVLGRGNNIFAQVFPFFHKMNSCLEIHYYFWLKCQSESPLLRRQTHIKIWMKICSVARNLKLNLVGGLSKYTRNSTKTLRMSKKT
jgi:hypothetical protein